MREKFKALVLEELNGPIKYREIFKPSYITNDFVPIRMQAAALNRRDYWISKGLYPNIAESIPAVLGSDGCGSYNGKEVIICPNINWSDGYFPSKEYAILGLEEYGTFAELTYVRKNKLFLKPAHLTAQEAACLPLGGLTAFRALFSRAKLIKGKKVLISGIGGGVALLAFQFAIAVGAEVYVTSGNDEKIAKAKELGAIDGVNYKDFDAMIELGKAVGGFDIVIDSAGGKGFNRLLKMCRVGANVSIYGGTTGSISDLSVPNLFFKQISIHGSTMGSDLEFSQMLNLVNEYKITPVIDELVNIENAAVAIEAMSENKSFGKTVIEIAD